MKNKRKFIACFLLVTFVTEITMPSITYALTDGPSLPEASGFASVDNSNLVDLFTGDFGYTLPLMDVGGYPITLSYVANPSMEQEASWVGLGWSLSPGTVNRNLRGLPDDFSGEEVIKDFSVKKNESFGIEVAPHIELFGAGKNFSGTIGGGLFYNSYKGFGISIEPQIALIGKTSKASVTSKLGLNINSQEGMEINPSVHIDKTTNNIEGNGEYFNSKTTIGGGISTRNGLKTFNFNRSTRDVKTITVEDDAGNLSQAQKIKDNSRSGSLSFSTPIFSPGIQIPMYTQSYSLDFAYGSSTFGFDPMFGFKGWYTLTKPWKNRIPSKAYGYLNEHLKTREDVLLDISREKDAPLHRKSKLLAVPMHTYDVFSVSGEGMNGQFRAYRGDVGILHDKKITSGSHSVGAGVELAGGALAHLGVNLNGVLCRSQSYKWKSNNKLSFKADFKSSNGRLDYEPSYFKMITEQVGGDMDYRNSLLKGNYILSPKLDGGFPLVRLKSEFSEFNLALDYIGQGNISQSMYRSYRDMRSTHISYFTNAEKERMGISHWIWSNPRNSWVCFNDGFNNQPLCWPASPPLSKPANQIGEFVITKPDGQIYTYGIPVYNNIQKDVSFSIQNQSYPTDGRITYSNSDNSLSNGRGLDNFYSSQTTPGYAHSFLLTSITSPDYSDRLNDGPSNDDIGKWVKFNYTRGNPNYKWRIPFKQMTANYNEGLHADPLDDKASYIYGEKELWNVHSIESRNYIAIFIVEDRVDGLPVLGESGGIDNVLSNGQVRLKEISLYSKAEFLSKGLLNATPIKTVHFVYENNQSKYGYSLCKGVDNSFNYSSGNGDGMNGKLTLNGIYFTYGKNTRGALNQYKFTYSNSNPDYNPMAIDRWGNYKRNNSPHNNSLSNHFFPYVTIDKAEADIDASAWSLTKIELPTGGSIEVNYESDDYAYVQNRRACEMTHIIGIGRSSDFSTKNDVLYDNSKHPSDFWFIEAREPVLSKADIKSKYIADLSHLYFKTYVTLLNNDKEYIEGYADILDYGIVANNSNVFWIKVSNEGGVNPVTKIALQLLRNDLQRIAKPNSYNPSNNIVTAVKGLIGSIIEMGSFIKGYENTSLSKYWAKNYDSNKFWVKLSSPDFKRLGGGSRVKSIVTSDDWMSLTNEQESNFTKVTKYIYTEEIKLNGITHEISSGVASYEPILGGEENVFRKPIRSSLRSNPLSPSNDEFVEEPVCESYFPAARVGYSKVKIIEVDPLDMETPLNNGYSLHEFYTSKNYPIIVQRTPVDPKMSPPIRQISQLINLPIIIESFVASQGYYVELNDMHGKPKSEAVYSKKNEEISGKRYSYIDEINDLGIKHLTSDVKGVSNLQIVKNITMGEDIDLVLDMREHISVTIGLGGRGDMNIVPPPIIPPIISSRPNLSLEWVGVKTAVALKMINRSGILQSVESFREGAVSIQENLAYDVESGIPIIGSSKDEFSRTQHTVEQPAYWKYANMGGAYRSSGIKFTINPTSNAVFLTNGDYVFDLNTNSSFASLLKHGDILLPLTALDEQNLYDYNEENGIHVGSMRYWISQPLCSSNGGPSNFSSKVIMNDNGILLKADDPTKPNDFGLNVPVAFKVIRSGNKNLLTPPMAKYNFVANTGTALIPVDDEPLNLAGHKMIDMTATEYNENWKLPSSHFLQRNCSTTFTNNWSCFKHFLNGLILTLGQTMSALNQNILYHPLNELLSIEYILNQSTTNAACSTTLGSFPLNNIYFSPVAPSQALQNTYYAHLGPDCFMGIRKRDNSPFHLNDLVGLSFVKDLNNGEFSLALNSTTPSQFYAFLFCSECEYECQAYEQDDDFNAIREGLVNRWLPYKTWVFNQEREVDANLIANNSGTYNYSSTDLPFTPLPNTGWSTNLYINNKWINSSKSTKVNKQSSEIEVIDALQIPSTSMDGYNGEVTVGVFKNANYHDTYFSSFEDLQYWTGRGNESCRSIKWSIEADPINNNYYQISNTTAHTGKRSIYLADANRKVVYKSLSPFSDAISDCNLKVTNNVYKFDIQSILPKLFLTAESKYIASIWVKKEVDCDVSTYGSDNNNVGSIRFSYQGNFVSPEYFYPKLPEVIIEGWQLYESIIIAPAIGTFDEFSITFESPTPMYIDDFRLVPLKAASQCYVYDPLTLKLMANLDDNHYATFYEYDDEGNLIRVKKETEKGIMTLNENRKNIKTIIIP